MLSTTDSIDIFLHNWLKKILIHFSPQIQRLCKRKYLGSVFNEHAALMMLFSGKFYLSRL